MVQLQWQQQVAAMHEGSGTSAISQTPSPPVQRRSSRYQLHWKLSCTSCVGCNTQQWRRLADAVVEQGKQGSDLHVIQASLCLLRGATCVTHVVNAGQHGAQLAGRQCASNSASHTESAPAQLQDFACVPEEGAA